MEYRREIDGLRALAVLPVLFFHAGFTPFEGGFIGVDVFFVISGYLITSIIRNELTTGKFTLTGFYERRARRILPALFLVAFSSWVFAWWWMMPSQLQDFSQSLVAVSAFSANIFFLLKSGYFEPSSELSPMLHTWSLAVEEQYYLFFPLLMLALWRIGTRTTLVTIGSIALASLVTAEVMSSSAPSANFFLATGRAWELMIGALLAFVQRPPPTPSWIRGSGAALGLGGIACSVFLFDASTPFPSLWTLLPTLGTAAIIYFASPSNSIGRLLGTQALVGVGLISYSTYLWHQPLFAFARIRSLSEPPPQVFLALCIVALGLGYLSWRYVEAPFRNRKRTSTRQVFVASLCGTSILAGVGLAGHWTDGFARTKYALAGPTFERFDAKLRKVSEERHDIWPGLLESAATPFSMEGERRRVLVLGDSLADDLFVALKLQQDRFPGDEFRRLRLDDLCMPALSEANVPTQGACDDEVQIFRRSTLPTDANLILISAGWDRQSPSRLESLLQMIGDRPTVVFGSAGFSEMQAFLYHIGTRSIPESRWPQFFGDYMHEPSRAASQSLRPVTTRYGARFVDKYEVFCEKTSDKQRRCHLLGTDQRPRIIDQSHLTLEGAQLFGRVVADRNWLRFEPDPASGSSESPSDDAPRFQP